MSEIDLIQKMSEIDNKYIAECNQEKKGVSYSFLKYAGLAACFAVCLIGAMAFLFREKEPDETLYSWELRPVSTEDVTLEIVIEKKWDEKQIFEKYRALRFNDSEYIAIGKQTEGSMIEKKIADMEAYGQDVYDNDTIKYCNCEVFQLKGISPDGMVAVRYQGDSDYYTFIGTKDIFQGQNLKELVNGYDLMHTMNVLTGYKELLVDGKLHLLCFENAKTSWFIDLIKDHLEAEDEVDNDSYQKIVSFEVEIAGTGYIKTMTLTDDGYLITNIGEYGHRYFIGRDAVQNLWEKILNECTGYEKVYETVADNATEAVSYDHMGIVTQSTSEYGQ